MNLKPFGAILWIEIDFPGKFSKKSEKGYFVCNIYIYIYNNTIIKDIKSCIQSNIAQADLVSEDTVSKIYFTLIQFPNWQVKVV